LKARTGLKTLIDKHVIRVEAAFQIVLMHWKGTMTLIILTLIYFIYIFVVIRPDNNTNKTTEQEGGNNNILVSYNW
jgi:hypothetical protein